MKYLLYFIILCVSSLSCRDAYTKEEIGVLYEGQKIAMPEYHRHITGYDSVQVIIHNGKWEANFCYPNKWEFNKFKLDTAAYIKINNHQGDIITDNSVKNVYNK